MDVFAREPPLGSPLLAIEHVVVTPISLVSASARSSGCSRWPLFSDRRRRRPAPARSRQPRRARAAPACHMTVRARQLAGLVGDRAAGPGAGSTAEHVLAEIAGAGYPGTELGPLGYLPREPAALVEALGRHRLALAAGFVMAPLASSGARRGSRRRRGDLRPARGGRRREPRPDGRHRSGPRRDRRSRGRRATARGGGLARLIGSVRQVAAIAAGEFSLRVSFHAHVGTHVEFEDEIERLLADIGADELGPLPRHRPPDLRRHRPARRCCAGHARPPRLRPPEGHRRAASRPGPRAAPTFDAAVGAGIFRPLGQGCVDFARLRDALDALAYTGWVTVEQDRMPDSSSTPLEEARASLAFLARIGFL